MYKRQCFTAALGFSLGTPDVFFCLISRKLLIGNVGDGEAVLSRGDEAVHMSPVHNPGRASENERILAANGWVTTEQVWCVVRCRAVSCGVGWGGV